MVKRRSCPSGPQLKLPALILLSLAAMALAFGRYLSVDRASPKVADRPALSGIAPIYRQLSAGETGGAATRGKAALLPDEDSAFSAPFLRLDDPTDVPAVESEVGSDYSGHDALREATVSRLGGRWSVFVAVYRRGMPDDFSGAAALVFNGSFASLFANLYDPQGENLRRNGDSALEEALNPFAKARQKEEAARRAASGDPAETSQVAARDKNQETASDASAAQQAVGLAGGPGVPTAKFVFLGDFDQSGALSAAVAVRSGDQVFRFPDGFRNFSLFVSPSPIERQKSIALEDVNGDGFTDLLTATGGSLFGGILLGDGEGSYKLAGTFLTGYEPVLVTVGPQAEGRRQIVTVNRRTGQLKVYDPRDDYRRYHRIRINLVPEYISHIVELDTGSDYLLAARRGTEPLLYAWLPGSDLERRAATLPAEPSLEAGPDGNYVRNLAFVQVHQVGAYASVVLADQTGQALNVANLRVTPEIYLVFGDLEGRGNLDLGVAHLLSFSPSK